MEGRSWGITAAGERTNGLKRAKKHNERLAKKAAAAARGGGSAPESQGLLGRVKQAAAGVAHAVGAAVHGRRHAYGEEEGGGTEK